MAINNGNTDFKLNVFQEGTNDQKIRIQFTPYNDVVSSVPISIRVYHPNGNVFTKSYTSGSKGVQITEYVDVPFYGEYRVHISTNQGSSWDMYQIGVKIRTSITTTKYTFTQSDINKDNLKQLIVSLSLGLLAGSIGAKIILKGKQTAGVAGSLMTAIGIWSNSNDTSLTNEFPKLNWSFQVVLTQSGNTITQTTKIWNASGAVVPSETLSRVYPTF